MGKKGVDGIKNISLFARKLVSRGRGEFIEGIFRFVLGDPSIPINHRRDICTVKPYATETCVYKGLFHLVTWPAHVTGPVRSHPKYRERTLLLSHVLTRSVIDAN